MLLSKQLCILHAAHFRTSPAPQEVSGSLSVWRDGLGLIKLWETLGKPLGTLTQNYLMSQDENTQSLWYSLILQVFSNTKCWDIGDWNLSPKPTKPTARPSSGGSYLFTSFISTLCQGCQNSGRWAVRLLVLSSTPRRGIHGGTDHQFVNLNYPVWMFFCILKLNSNCWYFQIHNLMSFLIWKSENVYESKILRVYRYMNTLSTPFPFLFKAPLFSLQG